jgi:hypothetical protein
MADTAASRRHELNRRREADASMSDAPPQPETPAIRVISTMTAAGYLWRAWCEEDGCSWKGPTRRGGFGGRQAAERDGEEHAAHHPAAE